jgi:large subunit ribosomal protein L4
MPKAPYLGKSGNADLDDEVFGEEFHMALVHEAVTAELNARRQGTSSTKTRGEVKMTGAKAFRQKGTGRARAGALSTPQRIGGGVAFGPKPRVFRNKVNRKARRRALRCVLSEHLRRGTLAVVDVGQYSEPATKTAADALAGFGEGRALVVLAREGEESTVKSFRNIKNVDVVAHDSVGVSDIIGAQRLVISQAAADYLTSIARKERAEAAA